MRSAAIGRATWGKFLSLLGLVEGSQIVVAHNYRPNRDCME